MSTLVELAENLTKRARAKVDYDEPYFEAEPLRSELVDLSREILLRPKELPLFVYSDSGLGVVIDDIVLRGLWNDKELEPQLQKLMDSKEVNVASLLLDRIHSNLVDHYFDIKELIKRNPNLPERLVTLAERSSSSDSTVKLIRIFQQLGVPQDIANHGAELKRLIELVEKYPNPNVLASAACCFATAPNQRISDILSENLTRLSDEDLKLKGQAVIRYLLNHSPEDTTVSKAIRIGLDTQYGTDEYPGKTGLLEAALYLKSNLYSYPRMEVFGLVNLYNRLSNNSLSPNNYSDEAALRYLKSNLRNLQYDEVISKVVGAIGSSSNPAALEYIEKALSPQSKFKKFIDAIRDDSTNMCDNTYRKVPALAGLAANKDPRAKLLYEKLNKL